MVDSARQNQDRRNKPDRRAYRRTTERRKEQRGARLSRVGLKQLFAAYIDNHKDVARTSLKRLLKTPVDSIMTLAVIAVALSLPTGLYLLLTNVQQVSTGWESAAQVSIYLKMDIQEQQQQSLVKTLSADTRVKRVDYISPEQGLAEFQDLSGFGGALEYLDDNPLPPVITLYLDEQAGLGLNSQALLDDLAKLEGVDQVRLDQQWLERLYQIMQLGERGVIALALVLVLAVLLVVGNTVRLAIEARRDEIVIVKLVGGTDGFVRRPFLYTGLWYGLGGGIIAWLILSIVLLWLAPPMNRLLSLYESSYDIEGLGLSGTLLLWISSALLGWVGAWIAVNNHLRLIEPR